ncbi:hypothetical protein I598_0181 [Isoptericola dokdonensis DS-3]|jgi:hypothetical protein|uniref:DUF2599 domain-containing protein n=2 Tax=Isoptericola TaxID=254250 RepID=A0A168E9R8_9MICO|nr:hypothetical protein I598_0181 [Isoptericola dokdonensis DS-3]
MVGVLAAALLTGCDAAAPGPAEAASPSAPPTPTPTPTAPDARPFPAPSAPAPTPAVVRAGAVELALPADAPTDRTGDGAVEITLDPATGDPATTLTLRSAGTFTLHPDGSATIADDGTAVGGLSAPAGTARFHLLAPDTLEVSADAETATTLGTSGVVSARWGDREGGDSLAVDATAWARHAGQAGVDVVWAELVAADAGVDTATMHDQLVCHALGAPDKDTWNLEPWRPDVGLVQVLAARCNPTG